VMGLMQHPGTNEFLVDLLIDVQTVRSCLVACERDPSFTEDGIAAPNQAHLSAGSLAMLRARPRMEDILRSLPGSSMVNAPSDTDLADPDLAAGLEAAFGGGGYTALQRSALLKLAWDHVGSTLDHRESVYELHSNGGATLWRHRLRRAFDSYNDLANGVLRQAAEAIPPVDLTPFRDAPIGPRRQMRPPEAKPER
jgi:aromatic ring hydroxylase